MKNIIFLVSLIFMFKLNAQVGIGTTSPRGALEINSSTNGLLIPRVSLTDLNIALPVVNPTGGAVIAGTLVWNTNTISGVLRPGYYYWLNNEWIRLGTKSNTIQAVGTSSFVEPNANIPGPLSAPTTFTNTTTASFDNSTVTRNIVVSGLTGNVGQITCNVKYTHTFTIDMALYLESPTGQIIELSNSNGGFGSANFNVTFSDLGALSIDTWVNGNVSGTYMPSGSSNGFPLVPNISTMSGFNGFSPNGTWKLRLVDMFNGDICNFQSVTLTIKTFTPLLYKLIGETSFVYSSNTKIVTNATYSANCVDDEGVITALTMSNATAGAVGTTIASVPGTVLSYASDSPKQGSNNYWVTTHNQASKNGLIDGNTYFIQLWVKGNIETPLASNQIYSMIPIVIEE